MAEGTGLEPYSPCQGLVRGQGGLQDVHACVDLPVHLPVAHQADEHLAHPISAPGATHWAGLTGPCGIDLYYRYACESGFVSDLALDLSARPRRETPIHMSGTPAGTNLREIFKNDDRIGCLGRTDEGLAHDVESL